MSSYACCSPSRYPSLLYAGQNALGTDGSVLVAMAPRDVAITEAAFRLFCISHLCFILFILGVSDPSPQGQHAHHLSS